MNVVNVSGQDGAEIAKRVNGELESWSRAFGRAGREAIGRFRA